MSDFVQHIEKLPPEAIMLVAFLYFMLQLVKLIFDWISKNQKTKSDGGVSHLTIYEKLGEHHGKLNIILEKFESLEMHMERFEKDFRLHTEDDKKFAQEIIKRLDKAIKDKNQRDQN